jgi:quinol-cytochrome oxidoreductase complex cytochrome b subunit
MGPDVLLGAQVIVNLFGAIPFIGPDLSLWIRGDYVVSDATLNRFFAFHVIAIPLVLLGLVIAHLMALHEVGSNNPDGIEVKDNLGPDGHPVDSIPSHPYYSVHDIFGAIVFLTIFSAIVFFAPEMGGYFLEYNNLYSSRFAENAVAYCAGLVFHTVLFDFAGSHVAVHVCIDPRGRSVCGLDRV